MNMKIMRKRIIGNDRRGKVGQGGERATKEDRGEIMMPPAKTEG